MSSRANHSGRGREVLELFESDFKAVQISKYAVYKNPSNLYENVINLLGVSRRLFRKGASWNCTLESEYKKLKARGFPAEDIQVEVDRALSNVEGQSAAKQTSMKDFFAPVEKSREVVNLHSTEDSVDLGSNEDVEDLGSNEDVVVDLDSIEEDVSEVPADIEMKSIQDSSISKLFTELGLESGSELEDLLDVEDSVYIVSGNLGGLISVFNERKEIVDKNCSYYQKNSDMLHGVQAVERSLALLSSQLEGLVENTCRLDEKTAGMKSSQNLNLRQYCAKQAVSLKNEIVKTALELIDLLPKINRKLQKRISNLKVKTEKKSVQMEAPNVSKSWAECRESLGTKTIKDGFCTLSSEEVERIEHFFDWLARCDHEWCKPQDVLNFLNKPQSELKNLTNLLVQNFPIIKLSKSGFVILLSAEEFFSSGEQLFTLMELFKQGESKEYSDDRAKAGNDKKARGKSGGRTPLTKSRPDVIQGIKDWTANTGITAHERRRDEIGQLGFTMQDLHRFVRDKFYPENPNSAPSSSTLRRLFSAPVKNRRNAAQYKDIIKAKPGVKRNNANAGAAHDHRQSCFTLVKMVREMSAKHNDDCNILSVDDKCKVPLGVPAVNRLSTLKKFFREGESPNMADHDHRSGLLICPNGYMVLTSKPGFVDKRITESARSMAEDEVEGELSDEEVIDILREKRKEIDDFVVEDNGNETIETLTETDINQNIMDPCACATTPSTCYDCGRPTCDLCSPNGEENSRRKCKLCFFGSSSQVTQLDGGFSTSDSDSTVDEPDTSSKKRIYETINSSDDEIEVVGARKASRVILDSEESESSDDDSNQNKFYTVEDELGRPHIKYPCTGEFFIFNKPNNYKPSTIERHVNDILNIYQVRPEMLKKAVLSIVADDGADWGMASLATSHYLLRLFKQLNLDALFFVKNAPGDSRYNAIEHGWGPISKRLAGVVIPAEEEGKSVPEVLDQGVELLTNLMTGMVYDSFKVTPVSVKSESDEINIEDKILNNSTNSDYEEVTKFYEGSITRERLKRVNPEIHQEALFLAKHLDRRLHFIAIRKCNPRERPQCKYCRENPPRASPSFWKDLPSKKNGGLFFDVQADPSNPGHNKTYMTMVKENPQINPDGEIADVRRCQVTHTRLSSSTF